MNLTFTVPGKPTGKGRPRFRSGTTKAGKKFVQTYTPDSTSSYEDLVRWYYKQAATAKGIEMFDGCICVDIYAAHPIPATTSQKQRRLMIAQPAPVKPDKDNIEKIIYDALNKIAWPDDNRVTDGSYKKRYADGQPFVNVTISEVKEV
jgi:Holliday junction resolvase RusA-like endonuclease